MLLDTFLGCSVFLITNLSLLYASHLLVRRYLHQSPASVRIVGTGTFFYAFIVLIYQALSPFHAISRTGVTIACLVTACLAHFVWGKHRDFMAEIDPIRLWLRDGLKSRWAVLIMMCGFMVLLSLSRALLMPPLSWDSLSYHLTFAALWAKKGTIFLFKAPEQIVSCGHLPINGEIFASWLLLPFSSDILVNTMNFPLTFLGGVACYAIGRELGLPRWVAGWAPVLICLSPTVYDLITTAYVDNALFAFCTISVVFVLRYMRTGMLHDAFPALCAAGLAVGTKYNGIIIAVIIVSAVFLKMFTSNRRSGFAKKIGICLVGLLVILSLGGRKYILNAIDAANPLYPFPLKMFNYEIFEGWEELATLQEWVSEFESESELDKRSFWEREYRKFCYLQMTPGPKFAFLLLMALISVFARPKKVSGKSWYFISAIWIIPILAYYGEGSTAVARGGQWIDGSGRYLITSLAMFTIQGVVSLHRFKGLFNTITVVLVAFVVFDLIHLNSGHPGEVELLYPVIAICVVGGIFFIYAVQRQFRTWLAGRTLVSHIPGAGSVGIISHKWIVNIFMFIIFLLALNLLQWYRDETRYMYYRQHTDLHQIPRQFVNAWEFLDTKGEDKVVAFTRGYAQPNHEWFFYPLLGSRLQNDITYLSALHKWEVPTWVDRGMLRGNDREIWFYNLKRKKVDYVYLQAPWPLELSWITQRAEDFVLVYSDRYSKIYKYKGEYSQRTP